MKNRLHLLALALGAGLLGSACTKKPQDAPAPTAEIPVGPSITGLVQPADAVLGVSLVDDNTYQPLGTAVPDGKGAYRFDSVPAGTYSLYFTTRHGYVPPRQQAVTVVAGKTTGVPLATAVQSTAAFTADGSVYRPSLIDLSIGFDGKTLPAPSCFSVLLSDDNYYAPTPAAHTYRLYLTMPYAVQVGTYPLNAASTYAIFEDTKSGVFDSRLKLAGLPSGGTLTITAVENTTPFPRAVSGTFSFTGTSPTLGTQKTFSGTFANAYF
ncbi:DUF6252 family protein [Hymenobacter artigasi]|uniref:Carboxypeptidase regulatory-like domain-containing protein n=1 Tax=Hymenobacter artigasi TaxID=2719616 RepID=A0ABX1HKI5_9BACT|nr:DUF6252 family protein [Hymenobacter artigasi]NKI90340.1 hypothetical protein [Hymenobacter artigasi]